MALNKTEAQLLQQVQQQGWAVVMHGYRTGRKRGSFGNRAFNAAIKLRDKGLVRFKKCESFVDCRSAYSDHWSEIVLERAHPAAGVSE